MILSPYFWLAVIISALAIFGTGYHNGYKHANDHAEALKLEAVTKARAEAIEQAKRDQQTAQKYETTRETVRTVFIKVKEKANENIVKNPGYAECGLDGDGLQLYNSHPGRAEDSAGSIDSKVSGSSGRTGRKNLNDSDEQLGKGADVLRLPG